MTEYTKVEGRNIGDIKMFALSTCGWCKKTKAFMKDHNVGFSYIDVDLLPPDEQESVQAEQLKYNPTGSFPTIVIDSNHCIVGFDEHKLKQLIGV